MVYHSHYILGAPLRKAEQKRFLEAVEERFGGDIEKASAYISHEAERQITKAGGFISSASILAGLSYFVGYHPSLYIALLVVLLGVGSFFSKWPIDTRVVSDPRLELERAFHITIDRCIANAFSSYLIIVTVILLTLKLLNS